MDRVILHSDLNNCYASIECLYRPELRDKPMAVGGDIEQRHGIILAKNQLAKRFEIKTGEAIWQARQKCPALVVVPPNFPLYLRFSQMARDIYHEYTDQVENFGIDESWLDVSGSAELFGDGEQIAHKIRNRIKYELGVTVSIGVSYNKIYAKLGSDYKKPDAVTAISRENYRDVVWPLPAKDLLYVGPATERKLKAYGIRTIGMLAQTSPALLHRWLGKQGDILSCFANGLDPTPVARFDGRQVIKSIGNSSTTPRDLESNEDVKIMFYVLAESVSARLREQGLQGSLLVISVRDRRLCSFTRQGQLPRPTCLTTEIAAKAMELFQKHYNWREPIRSIGIHVGNLCCGNIPVQTDLFANPIQREKQRRIECAVDRLRSRFGYACVRRAVLLEDPDFEPMNPKDTHLIHPVGYF